MSLIVQMLLLGICVSLCLPPGDAVKCRLCMSAFEGAPCLPPGGTCEADPTSRVCHTYKVTRDGKVQQKNLGCKPRKPVYCNVDTNTGGDHVQHICCDDKDFCNEHL